MKKKKTFVSAVTKTQACINGDTNVPYTITAANQTHGRERLIPDFDNRPLNMMLLNTGSTNLHICRGLF